MTSLIRSLTRSFDPYPPDVFALNGHLYPVQGFSQTLSGKREEIEGGYEGYVRGAYQRNGIVFACMLARQLLFSEARFQFQRMQEGRPGDLFGTRDLAILERPWPGGVTADLLAAMLTDVDLAGTSFTARMPGKLVRLRPDWTTMVLGSYEDPDVQAGDPEAEVLGYIYHPGGKLSGRPVVPFLREQVAQFQFVRDPMASFRGMSWLTPIVREIEGDTAATAHKLMFFENGATPNMVVSMDKEVRQQAFTDWVDLFKKSEPKGRQAYKTLYLGGGADAKVVGSDLKQLDFKITQGAGETRIAAAARVPPIIVGLSEGLEAATYSNYGQARRAFADGTMRPLWRNVAGSLETLVPPPPGARLWVDDRDIPFLREDRKDAAEIQRIKATTINSLVTAGYKPESVVAAVEAEDMGLLKHSGMYSVQLQPPGAMEPAEPKVLPVPQLPANAGRAILGSYLDRHSGPGSHPGTGSAQTAHGGGGGAAKPFGSPGEITAWGSQNYGDWQAGLAREERDALELYQSSGYRDMNGALRSGTPMEPELRAEIEAVERALASQRTDRTLVTYRAMSADVLPKGDLIGAVIPDKGFASTSLDPAQAAKFAAYIRDGGGTGVIAEITVPAGTQAAYLEGLLNPKEYELLLQRGASFRIVGTEVRPAPSMFDEGEPPDVLHVLMELLP